MKTCPQCQSSFSVDESDRDFLKRVSPEISGTIALISEPSLCPQCRALRRFASRNERNLYHRKCDKTGKQIISVYSPDKPYVVYAYEEWWKDDWDAKEYGRDFDFSRPFFEQFEELRAEVPRMSLQQENNQNSQFTSNVSHLKNCYLLFSSDYNEDCCYGTWVQRSKDCFDNYLIDQCERCYECVYSKKLYNCQYAYNSSNCSDSMFILDSKNLRNCFMCWGIRGKEYCIANVQYSKEEYFEKLKEFPLSSHKNRELAKQQFQKILKEQALHPPLLMHGAIENCTGDMLVDCQNCLDCYSIVEGRDCRYVQDAFQVKDIMDADHISGELAYESSECFPTPFHSAFNINTYSGSDLYYCDMLMNNSQNCFGSVGLKKAKYCILNKAYSQEEYETLLPQIIEHMKKTGEWGEFFPVSMSCYGYNESQAMDKDPLTAEEAKARGYKWHEEENSSHYSGPEHDIPDDIADVGEELSQFVLRDEVTEKAYKVIPQELDFYRQQGIPIPRRSPESRHKERLLFNKKRRLFQRNCPECSEAFTTTFTPEETEKVYCKACYEKTLY